MEIPKVDTLKVACPHCGSIDAFAHAQGRMSFASLLDEACALCGHHVTFADINDMRSQLAKAITFAGKGMRATKSRRVSASLAFPAG